MNNSDFQIEKEKHVKKINRAIQIVLANSFHTTTKEKFLETGKEAILKINGQRQGMYSLLDKFDDFKEEYDHKSPRFSENTPNAKDVTKLHMEIMQSLSEVIAGTSEIVVTKVVNPNGGVKVPLEAKKSYEAVDENIIQGLNKMIELLHEDTEIRRIEQEKLDTEGSTADSGTGTTAPVDPPATPPIDLSKTPAIDGEKELKPAPGMKFHKLTEADFDLNPELNNAGLNVGDTIEIPEESTVENFELDKNEAKKETAISIPAVTPIEEIQKQNDSEKKGPRKGK